MVVSGPKTGAAVWLAVWAAGFGIIALAAAAPALRQGHPRLSALIYAVFAPLCHQVPERCFAFRGFPMAVCARCLGIYAGFAAGALLHPALRGFGGRRIPSLITLALAAAPLGLDFAGNVLGVWSGSSGIRFLSGMILGGILPFFVIPAVHDLVLTARERRLARKAAAAAGAESS